MLEKESQGGCNVHGPQEVCGHTTETCPDIAENKMSTQAGDTSESSGGEISRDLQKEYHRLLREDGMEAAAQYLIDNVELNTSYVNRESAKLANKCADDLITILNFKDKFFKENIKQVSAAELRARLYADYRQQVNTERQRTKVSFKSFVTKNLSEIYGVTDLDELSEEDKEFTDLVQRNNERIFVKGSHDESDWEQSHTYRVHYKAAFEERKKEVDEVLGPLDKKELVIKNTLKKLAELDNLLVK